MDKDIPRLYSLVIDKYIAMMPEKIDQCMAFIPRWAAGAALPFESEKTKPQQTKTQGVVVLPLQGIIGQKMNLPMQFSGGTSTQIFSRDLRGLLADPEVGGVLIDIDSPGGSVYGTPELAEEIFKARGGKPIWGVANSMAASAAYWVGSAVEDLAITPSGEVGSVGVYALHANWSKANDAEGVKYTYIKAGRFKVTGNPDEPLDDESRAHLQEGVDRYYAMFVEAVAKYRGVSVNDVRSGFGEGGMAGAKDAVRMKMADRIGTLDETVTRMLTTINRGSKSARSSLNVADERRRLAYRNDPLTRLSPADRARAARYRDNNLKEKDEELMAKMRLA